MNKTNNNAENPANANMVLAEGNFRPFDDLIKEIKVNGEILVPAEKIAQLCFNYNEATVKNKCRKWVNNSYDFRMWYLFETDILKPKKHLCSIGIDRYFNVKTYHNIDGVKSSNCGMPASNQVEIVGLLVKWGFFAFC